jgi:outer membrane murein-binding lipoprotein Lpp
MGGGDNPVALALSELRTTLSNTNAPADQLKEKVEAVRSARQKAKADLETAEKNLRLLLTTDQEAVLVSLGYFE